MADRVAVSAERKARGVRVELERTGGYERTSGITIVVVNSRSVAGSGGDPRRGSFQPAFAEKTADEGRRVCAAQNVAGLIL